MGLGDWNGRLGRNEATMFAHGEVRRTRIWRGTEHGGYCLLQHLFLFCSVLFCLVSMLCFLISGLGSGLCFRSWFLGETR